MIGCVLLIERGRGGLAYRNIAGARLLTLQMKASKWPAGPAARFRAGRWAERMRWAGVRRAVFPKEFPWMEEFSTAGIEPVDILPLQQAMLCPLACETMERQGLLASGTIGICGDSVTQAVGAAAYHAAPRCRYMLLDVGEGGETLARELRRKFGVAPQLQPREEKLNRAEGLLLFSPRPQLLCSNPVCLAGYRGAVDFLPKLVIPEGLRCVGEEALQQDQLTAALWYRGVLSLEDIIGEIAG